MVVVGAGTGYLVVPDAGFKSALVKVTAGQSLKTGEVRSASGPVDVDTGALSPEVSLLFEFDVAKGPASATETAVTALFRSLGSTTTVTLPARQNGTVVRAELPGPGTVEVVDTPAASAARTVGSVDVVAGGVVAAGIATTPPTPAEGTAQARRRRQWPRGRRRRRRLRRRRPAPRRLRTDRLRVAQNRARFADIEFALQSAEIRDTKPYSDGQPLADQGR